MLTILS